MRKMLLVVLATALVPFCGFAVDGVVLINQAALNAAGGTYTITQSGSYKLSGNLVAKDQDTRVIVIAHDNVTIDLNGFAITGTADCSGGFCTNSGNGVGISTPNFFQKYFNITIRNGTIQGMGNAGISLEGDSILVEYMHIRSNGSSGIGLTSFSGPNSQNQIAQHNSVEQNGGVGIGLSGGKIAHNVVSQNHLEGIFIRNGFVVDNISTANDVGLRIYDKGGYRGNVMIANTSFSVYPTGSGVNLGQNLCNGAVCPGAVY